MLSGTRFSQPVLQTIRGAGLGNEIIPWGKAFIGAQELGLTTLRPAWSLNHRHYRHDFESPRADWVVHQALRALPSVTIGAAAASVHSDYAEVVRGFRDEVFSHSGPMLLRHASGMTGGFYAIRSARDYLRAELLRPQHVAGDMYQVQSSLDPQKIVVAVHIRRGDFTVCSEGPRPGQFNKTVPVSWYRGICESLNAHFGSSVQYVVYSDMPQQPEVLDISRWLNAPKLPYRRQPLLSDLWGMVNADLLLCSVSAMSMLAAFLSSSQYIWYEPHLGIANGWRGIWTSQGDDSLRSTPVGFDQTVIVDPLYTRGIAASEDGKVSNGALHPLEVRAAVKSDRHDLVLGGMIR